ncbi:MAG: ABC transporter permease [Clostridium sp.]
MSIRNMIDFNKKNEEHKSSNEKLKILMFFLSVIYFIVFDFMLFNNMFSLKSIWMFLALLVLAIYLFYVGISALIVCYIKNGGKSIFKNERLFLLRQLASKIKTMEFTMATLTIIFVFAILGGTIAMMFNDYIDKRLNAQLPFDIIIFNDNVNYEFKEELNIINENTKINDEFIYNIYEDGTDDINMYLRNEFKYFKNVESEHDLSEYFGYDTYMKISDYNKLRKMLGYKEVDLSNNGYIIQAKENIIPYVEEHLKGTPINKNGSKLLCEGLYTESFAQSGQNGADYIIVIPDKVAETMNLFYSLLAVDIEGESPDGLQEKLSNVKTYYDERGIFHSNIIWGCGTDQIITCIDVVLVQTNLLNEVKFILTAISFPFIYIGLVFLCVALTILSVQQISDSEKYKYRYSVLSKLGLNEREINRIILKQLLIYYLVPLITAVGISSTISLYISEKFIYYTLVKTSVFLYYGISIFILLIVYIIYFVVTYIEFKRGIHKL